ncbi:MAG: hypothetical protein ACLS9A_09250 [Clostridia bacterium]
MVQNVEEKNNLFKHECNRYYQTNANEQKRTILSELLKNRWNGRFTREQAAIASVKQLYTK